MCKYEPVGRTQRMLNAMLSVTAELAAEREILRRQVGVKAAPADSLRRLQERLAA